MAQNALETSVDIAAPATPHITSEDKDCISNDIQHIRNDRYFHREFGVSACTVKGSSCIKQGNKRIGRCRDQEIDNGILHNRRLHSSKKSDVTTVGRRSVRLP